MSTVYEEIAAERARAHAKHGAASCEGLPSLDLNRLAILMEKVGGVAREFNELRAWQEKHPNLNAATWLADYLWTHLRAEVIQVAAVASGWADSFELPEVPR